MESDKNQNHSSFGKTDSKVTQSWIPLQCNASCCLPVRYIIGVFLMLGFANVYALRVNLSVGLAVMVADLTVMKDGEEVQEPAEFAWSTTTQGIIFSAFYYGYLVTPLPAGHLARKLGGATVIGVSVGAQGALTLLTPLAARMHVGMFIALRAAIGFTQGLVFSAGHALWSKWAPPFERSKLGTLNFAGAHLGIILVMYLSGYITYHHGWPAIFYVSGIGGVIWSLIWLLLVRNSPSEQPGASREEVEYIELSLAGDMQSKDVQVPWKAIFTSVPVWAITVAHFAHAWGLYTMIAILPSFYIERFDLGLIEASVASTVPFVVTFIVVLLGGLLADSLRERNFCSTGAVRKIFTALGYAFPAVFFVAASYSSNADLVQALITLGMGLNGLAICGYYVNHLDIAPPLASVLLGITDTVATLAGIVSLSLTGVIVQHHSAEEWRLVFYIMGAIFLVGGTFYVLFASGEKQPWANGNEYDKVPSDELSPDKNSEQ